jgi:hypothetical protein
MAVEPQVPLWHIDAWDSRAGRAFLCRRPPGGLDDLDLDQATIFVCPPFFQPEPLASRAPGFSASRGSFQAGLFVDGAEVGFATLEDAIAFVRRGYNSHGSEPHPGAPAMRREGPLSGGGSDLAFELPELPTSSAFARIDEGIAAQIADFIAASAQAQRGKPAKVVKWELLKPALSEDIEKPLILAGLSLMTEMLRRFPEGGPAPAISWATKAHELGMQLVRLGIWSQVEHAILQKLQRYPADVLVKKFSDVLNHASVSERKHEQIVNALFGTVHFQRWALERFEEVNVYDKLATFPLPHKIVDRYHIPGGSTEDAPTLLTLLSAWFGYPSNFKDANGYDRALLVFGGACIVVGPLQRENSLYQPWWSAPNQTIQREFYRRLGEDCWKWIGKQLPDRAFPPALEGLLRQIPRVWATAVSAKAAELVRSSPIDELKPDDLRQLGEELGDVISDFIDEQQSVAQAEA